MPNLFPVANRQGTIWSGSYLVPDNLPGIFAVLTLEIGQQDLNSTKECSIYIEVSDDGGNTWKPFVGCMWKGPSNTGSSVSVMSSSLFNRRIRGRMDIPVQMRVGLSFDLVDVVPGPD